MSWRPASTSGDLHPIRAPDVDGRRDRRQAPDEPQDPSEAVLRGLEALLETANASMADVDQRARHDARRQLVIERKGARTFLLTTRAFATCSRSSDSTATTQRILPRQHPRYPAEPDRRDRRADLATGACTSRSPGAGARRAAPCRDAGAEALAVACARVRNPAHEAALGALAAEVLPGVPYVVLHGEPAVPRVRAHEHDGRERYIMPRFGSTDGLRRGLADQGFRRGST